MQNKKFTLLQTVATAAVFSAVSGCEFGRLLQVWVYVRTGVSSEGTQRFDRKPPPLQLRFLLSFAAAATFLIFDVLKDWDWCYMLHLVPKTVTLVLAQRLRKIFKE